MIPPIHDEDIGWAERTLGSGIQFDDEAREFIRRLDSLHLVACPGSGKTTALIAKLLILSRHLPLAGNRGICILTHTNVAVEQVRAGIGPHGARLFSYPNFCGTFQSFVGKYLGHPAYLEKFGDRVASVDDEIARRELLNRSTSAWRKAIFALEKNRIDVASLVFNQELKVTKRGSNSTFFGAHTETYKAVATAKMSVLRSGQLFYHDVFVLAERHLALHQGVAKVFPKRFPYVFVDEMQDTDERQTSILQRLFANDETVLQYIGDPNQAIYRQSSVGEGCSWRPTSASPKLSTSRRFGPPIAEAVSNLSVVSPVSVSGRADNRDIKPHLIVFTDSRIKEVIPTFAGLITKNGLHELPENRGFKAVGLVSKEHDSKHTLPNYWPQFDSTLRKGRSASATFKGNLYSIDASEGYASPRAFRNAVLTGLVGLLGVGGAKTTKGRRFTKTSLLAHLHEHEDDALATLEKEAAQWCLRKNNGQDVVDEVSAFIANWLPTSFEVGMNDNSVVRYLTDDEEILPVDPAVNPKNAYVFDGGAIEVSTVHAVKGETHTATLLLDTFYRGYDIHRILPHLKGKAATGREAKLTKESLKVAFVACSRPTHLLAVAIHGSTIGSHNARKQVTDSDLSELSELWKIVDLR